MRIFSVLLCVMLFISANCLGDSIQKGLQIKLPRVEYVNVELREIVKDLQRISGIKIVIDHLALDPRKKITFVGNNVTIREILREITFDYDLDYYRDTENSAKLLEKLDIIKVPPYMISEVSITEVMDVLRARADINIVIHPDVYKRTDIYQQARLPCISGNPIKVSSWLKILAEIYNISYVIRNGIIFVIDRKGGNK